MASKDLVEALELACAEICAGCRYDALLVAGDSGHHKPRIGGFTPCRARVQRTALANHKDCPEAQLMQLTADYLGEFLGAVERGVGAWKCYTAYVDGRYALIRVLSEQLFQEETENERLLAALRAIMDCHKNSIPVEIWAEARRVVEAAGA